MCLAESLGRSAQRFDDVPKLTALQIEALETFNRFVEDPRMRMEVKMLPGDVVLCSNHSCVHGRTAFQDGGPDEKGAQRHMLRLWLSLRNGRPLPPHYAELREHCDTYKRRMSSDARSKL